MNLSNKLHHIKFFFTVVLFFLSLQNIAQVEGELRISRLNNQHGLSHNIVLDIEQDRFGFIWIATQDGLNRFDGYEFKSYRFNPNDTNSIAGNYIKSLYVDINHNLWVSTNYGLNLYCPERDNFSRFIQMDDFELDITKITGSSDGNVWLSSYGNGFHKFDITTKSITSYNTSILPLSSDYILTLHEDRNNRLWVGTVSNGIQVFVIKNDSLILDYPLNKLFNKLNISRVESIFEDLNDNIWIGCKEGLLYYNNKDKKLFHIQKTENSKSLSDNIVLDISMDYKGNLLVGTQEGGLNILSPDQLKANNPVSFQFNTLTAGNENDNLSYRSVQSIFEDKDKNLWLGTFGGGINLIPLQQPIFKTLKHHSERTNSLNYDKVWGICEDKNGLIWIGTDGMGLNIYDQKSDNIGTFGFENIINNLSKKAVLSAYCDSKGILWFGTYANGLYRYDKSTKSLLNLVSGNNKTNLPVNDIRCIYETKNGLLFLGTNGGGLVEISREGNVKESFVPTDNNVSAYDIRCISEDVNGNLWLGTYGTGLFRYHIKTKQTKHYSFDRNNTEALNCNIIYALYYDEQNNQLWIGGSQNGGLNLLDISTDKFITYGEAHGLLNNNIHAITKDKKNRIWISTNSGISYFDQLQLRFRNFNMFDGVQEKEFSNGSILVSKNFELIGFGGSGGFNYFNPNSVELNDFSPNVIITALQIFDGEITNSKNIYSAQNIKEKQNNLEAIELNYQQNVISISYSAINYSNPHKIDYQYKLEGVDLIWNNQEKDRSVTFRNLNPGEYTFLVRASNESGQWTDNIQKLKLKVNPPPWKTWWALTIYFISLSGLIFLFYSYKLKEAKTLHSLDLEHQLRLQEQEYHNERINFFTFISHELRTPLMLLLNPLDDLLTRENPLSNMGRTYSAMHRNATKLLHLTNTLLEFRKTESGNLKLKMIELNVVDLVDEICIMFKGLALKNGIDLSFKSTSPNILLWCDKEKFEMIMNNLISNAIKNTPKDRKIKVRLQTYKDNALGFNDGVLKITVLDQGKGIPADQINRIFDNFFQVVGSKTEGGSGIGLALTKRLVELHHGIITIESELNQGTTFYIEMPLGKAHLKTENIIANTEESLDNAIEENNYEAKSTVNAIISKITSLTAEKKKILIVEDNDDIRSYLVGLLEKAFLVEEASNGEIGLEMARNIHPTIIISDVMMPKLDGVEMCSILKTDTQTSHIPIILITANISQNVHIGGLDVGADAFITKPFKPEILISKVYNLLRQREKLQEYYLKRFQGGLLSKDGNINKDEEFLIKVNRLVYENLSNSEFSVDILCESLAMSRTAFYSKLKSLTNLTPIDLIRQLRLKRASELISKGELKIYEVMYEVGFNDEKHFRQLFKSQFGVNPTTYYNLSKKSS